MSLSKEEVIKAYGKNDGHDEDRYEQAVKLSPVVDRGVSIVFRSLVNLENRGLINLEKLPKEK